MNLDINKMNNRDLNRVTDIKDNPLHELLIKYSLDNDYKKLRFKVITHFKSKFFYSNKEVHDYVMNLIMDIFNIKVTETKATQVVKDLMLTKDSFILKDGATVRGLIFE